MKARRRASLNEHEAGSCVGPGDSILLTLCIPHAQLKASQCAGVFGTACVRAWASNSLHLLSFLPEGGVPDCLHAPLSVARPLMSLEACHYVCPALRAFLFTSLFACVAASNTDKLFRRSAGQLELSAHTMCSAGAAAKERVGCSLCGGGRDHRHWSDIC